MITKDGSALIGITSLQNVIINPAMANRHGLITGATGTGKTITLQVMAETFSQMGVPVFAADAKGDLSGIAQAGGNKKSVVSRVEEFSLEEKGFSYQEFPVQFWDVFANQGAAVRATVASLGPLLLSRLLSLNDTQTSVLTMAFTIAKDENLRLIDLKDLRTFLAYLAKNTSQYSAKYGTFATMSIGAIQRNIVAFEHSGSFFGEPSLSIEDLLRTKQGKGVINILASDKLMQSPAIYTSFLLWFMNELFTTLPEVGDLEKPKLVFFFDEAHLLFSALPKVLLETVERVVRLIRSKGIGIYFITQNPSDIPDSILGQLGNRVQHALRTYTPKDRTALKAAAMSFRQNPKFDTETAISELETGEALLSFLDTSGAPTPVERTFIIPPQSSIGPLETDLRVSMMKSSPLQEKYENVTTSESAYDVLAHKMANSDSERDEKEREKNQKEEEKRRAREEKAENRESAQRTKFWTGIVKSIVVPFARKMLQSYFKR